MQSICSPDEKKLDPFKTSVILNEGVLISFRAWRESTWVTSSRVYVTCLSLLVSLLLWGFSSSQLPWLVIGRSHACVAMLTCLTVQGFEVQGFEVQGFEVQGFAVQGFEAQGFEVQGFEAQGFEAQGFVVYLWNCTAAFTLFAVCFGFVKHF